MNSKTIYLTLVLLAVAFPLQAQRTTPKTDINLPSDTTKVQPPAEKKPEPDDPKLELPDVLILGQDRYHRTVRDKKNLAPESPTLIRNQAAYEPLSTWFSRDAEKPSANQSDTLTVRQVWAKLKGGSFYTVLGEAGYWQKLLKGDALGSVWFDRSEGQFANTKYAQGGFSGKVSYELAPQVTGIARAAFNKYSRGLHTIAYQNEAKRFANHGFFAADMHYDINNISDGNLGFELGGLALQSDTSGTKVNSSDDFYYNIHFNYTAQYNKMQFSAQGKYVRETLNVTEDSLENKAALGTIGIEALQPLSTVFSAAVGVNYDHFTLDAQSRFSPYARINLIPSPNVGFTLHVSTGLAYSTFVDYWQENTYITHAVPMRPSEETLGLQLKMDVELSEVFKLHAGYKRQWMETLYYWQADSATALIGLKPIFDARVAEIQLGAVVALSEKTQLQVTYIDYSDQVSEENVATEMNQIPYRADFRLPIRASIQLLPDMNLTLTADFVGERKKQLGSKERLPAFGLFHVDVSKDFGETLTGLLTVNNLLDASYSMWEGYPETGIQVLAGLRAKF